MKVLIVNGSSHRESNVLGAIGELKKTFAAEGVEVENVELGIKRVSGCLGCFIR